MDYTNLIPHKSLHEAQAATHPLVREIEIPSFGECLKKDLVYHVATGLIFGVGHFIGAFLMKKALG